MSAKKKPSPDSIVREIKRKTRRKYSAEEKGLFHLRGCLGQAAKSTIRRIFPT